MFVRGVDELLERLVRDVRPIVLGFVHVEGLAKLDHGSNWILSRKAQRARNRVWLCVSCSGVLRPASNLAKLPLGDARL